jgi:hypothetical protein
MNGVVERVLLNQVALLVITNIGKNVGLPL